MLANETLSSSPRARAALVLLRRAQCNWMGIAVIRDEPNVSAAEEFIYVRSGRIYIIMAGVD